MESIFHDLRYAVRSFAKKPGFTVVAVLTLALGIGANTAVFSVVNAVLVRPLPYKDPDRIALIKESLPKLGWNDLSCAAAEFLDYQDGNATFSEIAGFTDLSLNLTGQGEPLRVQAARVSASLFPLLGVAPLRGRFFSESEDRVGGNGVAIIGYGLWQSYFGADHEIIGKVVKLDDRPFEVVGVMPPRFEFPYNGGTFARAPELWVPLALTDQEKKVRASDLQYGVIGRLKPGISLVEAQADIDAVAARFQQQYPETYGDVQISASVIGLKQDIVKKVRLFLLILLGAVGLVLLIACANVANLLLARAVSRQKEIAIRRALGAGPGRIIRQLLTESVLLSLLGAGFGLLISIWTVELLTKVGPKDVPRLHEISLDPLVLGFTLIVAVITGVLFGLAPALQSSRVNLNEVLKDASGRGSRGSDSSRLRALLVVFETASAFVLLVCAALLLNSFVRLLRVPPGFSPDGVVIAQTALPTARYRESGQSKRVQRQILERLEAIPGVQAAGVTTNLPLVGDRGIGFLIEGDTTETVNTAYNAWVSNDYFRAMGIQFRAGRSFTDDDRETTQPVILVNETMQHRFWPAGDAIGKRIKWGGWNREGWLTIVGVVADVKVSSLEVETRPAIYMPIFQIPRARSSIIYVVRSSGDPSSVVSAIRSEIKAIDAELPVYDVRTMNQVVAASVAERRFAMMLLAAFALVALSLAAVGLYGVISFSVTERTREIGIRMAMGASYRDILRLVVGHGLALSAAGIVIGIAAAVASTRLMASLLFGVSATDLLTFAIVSLVLTGVALGACFVPARRAAKVDPMVALRYE
jgi:putative ABC transport system permease protein